MIMDLDKVIALLADGTLHGSMTVNEMIETLEEEQYEVAVLPTAYLEIYRFFASLSAGPHGDAMAQRLHVALSKAADPEGPSMYGRLLRAQQFFDNLGRDRHGTGRSFEYIVQTDGQAGVLWLHKVDTVSQHRSFLDAVEEAIRGDN